MKLHVHEDGSVSVRVTPIENGYVIKPGGKQPALWVPTAAAAGRAVSSAIHEAWSSRVDTDRAGDENGPPEETA